MAKNETLGITLRAKDDTSAAVSVARGNLDKLSVAAQKTGQRMASSLGAIKNIMAFSFLGGVGVKLKNTTLAFATQIDTISKNARLVGMNVAEYQKLGYAFERQGVSTENMYASLKRFNIVLGDLKNGQGSLAKQLSVTNPKLLAQIKGAKTTSEAFLLATDAIKSQGDASLKSSMAIDFFGRSGAELNKVFEAGSEGLYTLMSEQEQYGTLTDEQGKGAESFVDSLTKLQTAFKSMSNMLLAQLMPILTSLFESFASSSQKFKPVISMLVSMLAIFIKVIPYVVIFYTVFSVSNKIMLLHAAYNKLADKSLLNLLKSTKIFTIVQSIFNAVMAGNPLFWIPLAIAAAVVAVILIIKYFDKIVIALKKVGQTIAYVFSGQWFKGFFTAIKNFVLHPIDSILQGFKKLWNWINVFNKKKQEKEGKAIKPSVMPSGSTPLEAEGASGAGSLGAGAGQSGQTTVDVNFNNMPKGTMITQSKPLANVNLNLGFTR